MKLSKLKFLAAQNQHKLWFISGGIMFVAAVKAAWDASPRYKEIVEEHEKEMETYKKAIEIAEKTENPEAQYPLKQRKADKRGIYIRTGVKHAKNMMKVAVAVGLSFMCFGKSFGVLNGWFKGATALYLAKNKELKHIEGAVAAKYGKDVLEELKGPGYEETVVESKVDPETGEETVTTEKDIYDMYSMFFDESNPNWTKNPNWNRNFLQQKENWMNRKLLTDGYLFLNDVLDTLQMPLTDEGQLVGWLLYDDPQEAKKAGASNRVDFGLYRDDERARAFMNGEERSILLHFNVDPQPIIGRTGYLRLRSC